MPAFQITGKTIPAGAAAAAREDRRRQAAATPGTPEYNLAHYGCECGRRTCDH